MLIIAHRGNVNGPGSIDLKECYTNRWGFELDLRWDQDQAYFNHEPHGYTLETDARRILLHFDGAPVAVNIKEANHINNTLDLLKKYPKTFVFDMELIGIDPYIYSEISFALRVSDRADEKGCKDYCKEIIWLDEFKEWVTESDLDILTNRNVVYWVSPELHKPITTTQEFSAMEARWEQMYDWGVDGICTDYPRVLASRMEEWGTPQDPNYRASQLSESPIG